MLSFTEASKALFITQSTLSISIRQLEDELGTNLFDRIGKKVYLTDMGQLFLNYARAALTNIHDGMQEINISKQIYRGKLSIGVTYSTCEILNSHIVEYTRKYPNIHLTVIMFNTVDEVISGLLSNKLDIAITYTPEKLLPSVCVEPVVETPLLAIVCKGHPLAERFEVTYADIVQFPFATFLKGMHTRAMIDRLLAKNNIQLEPQIEVNDTNLILDLVRTGHWVSILSPLSVQNKPNFVALPIKGKPESLSVSVLWLKGKSKQTLYQTLLQEIL